MAYVNVKDWSVDQVTDWLKGLDINVQQYMMAFLNNGVNGHYLLNLRADDLDNLGVKCLGHQEIILESVEHLRHFHYELDKENLQLLALRVTCAANSLDRQLIALETDTSNDQTSELQTQTLADVHNIILTIKPLIYWLDRAPFCKEKDYIDYKTELIDLSFRMVTNAHRGKFSDNPVSSIKESCKKITKLADEIIQEVFDPMILQPASLDLATLKKKEQELGFLFSPHNHAVHQIGEIKYGSPAHTSSKIEEGDEVVQVNYQTVVGWQRKHVMLLLQDSPPEIVLTLKKRPRHTKIYGQIYMKPYRLPSKKRRPYSRWNDGLQSPRLLPIPNLPPIIPTKLPSVSLPRDVETESSSSDSEPPDSPLDEGVRMYPLKPQPILQRRHSITGSTLTSKRPYPSIEQYWQIWKNQASVHVSSHNIDNLNFDTEPNILRDKSASCSLGLELSPRPTTVIGIGQNNINSNSKQTSFIKSYNKEKSLCKKRVNFEEEKQKTYESDTKTILNVGKSVSINSLGSLSNENIAFIDEGRELTDRSSMVTEVAESRITVEKIRDSVLNDVKIYDIIKKFDEHQSLKPKTFSRSYAKKSSDVPEKNEIKKPIVPLRNLIPKSKGRLDKSHSTPAYDLTGDELNLTLSLEEKKLDTVENSTVDKTTVPSIIVNSFLEPDLLLESRLGIPLVKTADLTLIQNVDNELSAIDKQINYETELLPPKPPPRTCTVVLNRPTYLIDLPKPNIVENLTLKSDLNFFELKLIEDCNLDRGNVNPPISKVFTDKIRSLEPKLTSTPKLSEDISKSPNETKILPTNSVVRAIIYSSKGRSGKKKNFICAKRRKVSVSELPPSDNQGFLYQRFRSKHNQNVHWEKRWFVLIGNHLYGFKTQNEPSAACLIFLSGFTVAVANEVKSRSNAFKVYHTGTVFYFSADDSETLQQWIETITAATLNNDTLKSNDISLYSETDESDNENKKKVEPEKLALESVINFGSLKKFTKKKHDNRQNGSTSLDRKWLFNKPKNLIPVPTAQYRSYRKMRNTTDIDGSVTTGNFTSHVPFFTPNESLKQSTQNISVPNLIEHSKIEKKSQINAINYVHTSNPSLCNLTQFTTGFTSKKISQNKNTDLAGFVTLEQLMIKQSEERRLNPYNTENEFSINFNLIRPDVVYGEVPIRPKEKIEVEKVVIDAKKSHSRNNSIDNKESTSSCFGKRLGSFKKAHKEDEEEYFVVKTSTYPKLGKGFDKKLNRSLPRTAKLPDLYEKEKVYASDRNLTERSYEMIFCPEQTSDIQFALNRHLDKEDTTKHLSHQKSMTWYLEPNKLTNKISDLSREKPKDDGRSKKKKKSPKLHRAFFGQQFGNTSFSELTETNSSPSVSNNSLNVNPLETPIVDMNFSPHTDYPGLEYPPVFEPETYSLADPQSSLTLLRKQK